MPGEAGGDADLTGDGAGRPYDALLIPILAGGGSIADAARAANKHERTVRRRRADPLFRSKVRAARASLLEESTARLVGLMESAVKAVEELLQSEDGRLRLRAAEVTFTRAQDGVALDDLGEQVRTLGEQVDRLVDKEHNRQ